MPKIRIEWVPVQAYGLGLLGFDHLQLVYQQDEMGSPDAQDHWYVMEGVRDAEDGAALLGIEGADGRTTLSIANVAAREELIAKIGTPSHRGSRSLPYGGDEFHAWETMASYARDIEQQDFPYIAYGLPGSPTPTVNSSSAIASLIHYSGFDPSHWLPFGVRLSPGTGTLLGTGGDDIMRTEHGFTTLLAGRGRDELAGGIAPDRIEKFYGGEDQDLFHWSSGFNILHGGQPQLDYESDGTDVVDYSGAGTVTITVNRHAIPHKVPDYVAVFSGGLDHLFSVERVQWNETTDHILLGSGVSLKEDDAILGRGARGVGHDSPSHQRSGLLLHEGGDAPPVRSAVDYALSGGARDLELLPGATRGKGNAAANRLIGNGADNVLVGLGGDDTLYGGAGNDALYGGSGSDGYVYLHGDENDVIIDDGPAADVDELVLAGGIAPGEIAFYRPADRPGDLVLALADGDSIRIEDFAGGSGIERVVFDLAPALTRDDLERLAAEAPLRGAPSPVAAVAPDDVAAHDVAPGPSFADNPPVADAVPALFGDGALLGLPDGWLF